MSNVHSATRLRSALSFRFCLNPGIVLAVLLVVLLPLPWPTLSGIGLDKPINLMTWVWICFCGLCLIPVLWRRRLRGKNVILALLMGAILMALPLLWTPDIFRANALMRLAGIAAIAMLFALLLQLPVRGDQRRKIYGVVVIAGLIQVAMAFWQIGSPSSAEMWLGYNLNAADGRPLGSLNQVNLLSSFLVTALACSVWLALSIPRSQTRSHLISRLNMLAIVLLSAGVVMSQSRSMQASALLTLIVLVVLRFDSPALRKVLLCLYGGLMLGLVAQPVLQTTPLTSSVAAGDMRPNNTQERLAWNRQHSNNERMTLFKGALLMKRENPLAGEGLGSFEVRFPQVLRDNGAINPFPVTAVHPHNELLYVWFEGGVVALTGFLLWLVVGFKPFLPFAVSLLNIRTHRWRYTALRGRNVAARGALLLPVMAHMMSEYPLYQSVIHLVLLAILLWLALPVRERKKSTAAGLSATARWAMTILVALLSLAGMVFMVSGVYSSLQLHEAESFDLMDSSALSTVSNPWAQADRLMFDRAVKDLMVFNQTHDRDLLTDFQQKAGVWLSRHNDANLTLTMLQIAHSRNDSESAHYWRERGCLSFYQDARFRCSSLQPVSR
ncbi:hypothetical protein LJPFL01_3473 [Lelliottia jeotgali]|nr:hypothetical protein LJPFL01_3473 [Lelliottia jeotgali]